MSSITGTIAATSDARVKPSSSLWMMVFLLMTFVLAAALFNHFGPIGQSSEPLDWHGNSAGAVM